MVHVVPTSLRDLLAELLDRLGPAKETAQAAAVIGQEFDARLLDAITDAHESRKGDLTQLVDAQIVVRRGSEAATTYAFRHALIQEAAYQSLLRSRRREHHRRIAESLERGVVPGSPTGSPNASPSTTPRPASPTGRSTAGCVRECAPPSVLPTWRRSGS
jgi:ATP/maltotriose-dependent transcriptional regulator MalT